MRYYFLGEILLSAEIASFGEAIREVDVRFVRASHDSSEVGAEITGACEVIIEQWRRVWLGLLNIASSPLTAIIVVFNVSLGVASL